MQHGNPPENPQLFNSSPLNDAAESLVKLGFTARDSLRINPWKP